LEVNFLDKNEFLSDEHSELCKEEKGHF